MLTSPFFKIKSTFVLCFSHLSWMFRIMSVICCCQCLHKRFTFYLLFQNHRISVLKYKQNIPYIKKHIKSVFFLSILYFLIKKKKTNWQNKSITHNFFYLIKNIVTKKVSFKGGLGWSIALLFYRKEIFHFIHTNIQWCKI